MSRETDEQVNSRRSFLRGLAVIGGVTAIAASAGADDAEAAADAPAEKVRPKGYRVTPHIAKYYDKARI